jgi:chemotaxis protein MotB
LHGTAVAIAALATQLVLTGCVSRGAYDEVVAERDSLQRRNVVLAHVTAGLSIDLALRDQEIALLEQEQQELADEVARWAIAGAVQMQLLADGLHLILPHEILFRSGSAELTTEGRALVTELAAEIKGQPYQIAVLGFTDNVPVGADLAQQFPSNWELAGARASSVVRVMQGEGIPVDQLLAISQGEGRPIATNDTPEGRAQNRRIDVRIRPVIAR